MNPKLKGWTLDSESVLVSFILYLYMDVSKHSDNYYYPCILDVYMMSL